MKSDDRAKQAGDILVEIAEEMDRAYLERYGSKPDGHRFKVSNELWEVRVYKRKINPKEKRRIRVLNKEKSL
jgi:hypothetical protein